MWRQLAHLYRVARTNTTVMRKLSLLIVRLKTESKHHKNPDTELSKKTLSIIQCKKSIQIE